jgi:hypothetical protein
MTSRAGRLASAIPPIRQIADRAGVDVMYSVLYWSVVALLVAWIFFAIFEIVKGF